MARRGMKDTMRYGRRRLTDEQERVTVTAPAWRKVQEEVLLAAEIGGYEKLTIKNMFAFEIYI